jgi:hypothetical protein
MKQLLIFLLLCVFVSPAFAQSWSGTSSGDAFVLPPNRFCLGQDDGKNACFSQSGSFIARLLGQLDFAFVPKTVATLPSASLNAGRVFRVTDGQTTGDCTAGGGSSTVLCISNGATWQSSGGAGGAVPTGVASGSALVANGVSQPPVYQLKPAIDPRDYGVDCTDTNDSTTAWAAAVTAAGNFGKIVVPKGCLFKLTGTPGWSLYKVYGLEVEFSGRQGNGCDNQGNPAGIDYRQAYAGGNTVVSIVDSQRLLIKNLTIYTNGGADTGVDIDQDLLTPPITTRDDFYNVCIYNNTSTRNAAWNGLRLSFVSISNVENIHFYHPDVTCSIAAPTSVTSNGNAIYFGANANLKNEIVDDYRTTNCSKDVQGNGGSDQTFQFGLASNSWLNVQMDGFNDALSGFRSENATIPVQINNPIGPHFIYHNDFSAIAGGNSPIDCLTGCGRTTVISNETDSAPTNWFNVHGNPGASGPLFAAGNRFFTWNPTDWQQGAFVIGSALNPLALQVVDTFSSFLLTPAQPSGAGIGSNAQSPAIDLQSLSGNSAVQDDYFIQNLPSGSLSNTPPSSTLELGHPNVSTIAPWLAFNASLSGATFAASPVPAVFTIVQRGVAGGTSYTYEVVAHGNTGTVPSATVNTVLGNATLTTSNYNLLQVRMNAGCTFFDIYRTASSGTPASTGKIGTLDCFTPNALSVIGSSTLNFADTALVGDLSSPPIGNTTGQLVSTVPTGLAPLAITSTTPVANLTLSNHPILDDCGSTSTCSVTQKTAALIVRGSVAFPTATTVTVTALPFTGAANYSCTAGDVTTAAGVINATTYTSGSSVTFTETNGTTTDTMRYICVGF